MRAMLSIGCGVVLAITCAACRNTPSRPVADLQQQDTQGVSGQSDSNQAQVTRLLQEYAHAFNQRDLQGLQSSWMMHGLYLNPDKNVKIESKQAIAQYIAQGWQESPKEQLNITVDSIDLLDGVNARIVGQTALVQEGQEPTKMDYEALCTKVDGRWLIQQVTEKESSTASDHAKQLEPLSWLIGEWEDTSDQIDVQTQTTWGYGGQFIIQHFVVQMEDQEQMSGEQWIGWDPYQKKIRSWVFDSDGGVAEGVWSQDGKNWLLHLVATLNDGKRGSGTYLFSHIEPGSYVWESNDRQVGDLILENVGPVSVVRRKPS